MYIILAVPNQYPKYTIPGARSLQYPPPPAQTCYLKRSDRALYTRDTKPLTKHCGITQLKEANQRKLTDPQTRYTYRTQHNHPEVEQDGTHKTGNIYTTWAKNTGAPRRGPDDNRNQTIVRTKQTLVPKTNIFRSASKAHNMTLDGTKQQAPYQWSIHNRITSHDTSRCHPTSLINVNSRQL